MIVRLSFLAHIALLCVAFFSRIRHNVEGKDIVTIDTLTDSVSYELISFPGASRYSTTLGDVIDMADPLPLSVPKNMKHLMQVYPERLLDTLMRSYCEAKTGRGSQFFCNKPNSCHCYREGSLALDSILSQDTSEGSKRTIIGVPYDHRSTVLGDNFVSLGFADRCMDTKYNLLSFRTTLSSAVQQSEITKTLEKYKTSKVRGEQTTTVNDVLSYYMKDPICVLGSSLYHVKGWDPTVCADNSSSYRLLHQKQTPHKERVEAAPVALIDVGPATAGDEFGSNQCPVSNKSASFLEAFSTARNVDLSFWDNTIERNLGLQKAIGTFDNTDKSNQIVQVSPKEAPPVTTETDDEIPQTDIKDPLDFCDQWDILEERHGTNIANSACPPRAERLCDTTPAGKFCRPLVQKRIYKKESAVSHINVDHYTFSPVFALYLGPVNLRCGSPKSLKEGIHYMKDPALYGVRVLDEITVDNHRIFKAGPFNTTGKAGTYNICACWSNDGESDVKTCTSYSEYNKVIGQVIIVKDVASEVEITFDSRQIINIKDHIALVVDQASGMDICGSLFDLFGVNWSIPMASRLHSYAEYIKVNKSTEVGVINILFHNPGVYRICMVNVVTGEVREHEKSYAVTGIRNNASAVIYKNISGDYVGTALLFEQYNRETLNVESIYLASSESDCNAPIVGHWAKKIHPYYTHRTNAHMSRWVASGLELYLGKAELLPSYSICVSYSGKSGKYRIGGANVQNYAHVNNGFLLGTPFDIKGPPNDVFTYPISVNSEEMVELLDLLATRNSSAFGIVSPIDNRQYYYGILDGAEVITLQFRVHTSSDIVSLWLISDNEPTPFPLRTFHFSKPLALRLGRHDKTLYIYLLMGDGHLYRAPFRDLFDHTEYTKHLLKDKLHIDLRYMDLLQKGNTCWLAGVDVAGMCLYLFDANLGKLKNICTEANASMAGIDRISCVRKDTSNEEFNCFVIMPLLNEVLWIAIDESHGMTIVDRFKQSDAVYDLDPIAGSPTSLFAVSYNKDAMVFVIYESGEHGLLLKANETTRHLEFTYSLMPAGYGYLMRHISPIMFNSSRCSIFAVSQPVPTSLLDPSLNVDDVMKRAVDVSSVTWRYTWITLDALIKLPNVTYDVPQMLLLGHSYDIEPTIDVYSHQRIKTAKYRVEPKSGVERDTPNVTVSLNDEGVLHITSGVPLRAKYDIIMNDMWISTRTTVNINVNCADGMYFNGTTCKMCPFGTYNSHQLSLKNPELLHKCSSCPDKQTTKGLGSTSAADCTCIAGYTGTKDSTGVLRCEPCGTSSFKSLLGFDQCTGTCGANAYSIQSGSRSYIDMFCRCFPGYYFNRAGGSVGCKPCEEGYYCVGGYKARQKKCPIYTTTLTQAAKSIDDCVCSAGYEPANPTVMSKAGTYEYDLAQKIKATHNLTNYHKWVCVPCANNMYKSSPSSESCTRCPQFTYSLTSGNSNIEKCNRCEPGYYETNDPLHPCEICPPNYICVGSDPLDPALKLYSGKRTKCDKNSVTLAPYEKNTHVNNCLCDKGYTARTRNGVVKCEAVPKSTYKDVIGNVAPKNCPEGAYTPKPGATKRSECVCNKGMYFDEANKRCTICPVGKYCLGGRLPNGEHMPPTVCTDSNSITTEAGASSSSECLCKPGFYMRQDGYSGCIECPENTYKSHVSNESCTPCDKNSLTFGEVGATSKEQCVCAPGYYFDGTCKACGYPDKYCPGGSIVSRDEVTGEMRYETKPPVDCPPNTEIPPGVDTADSVDSCKCGKGYGLAKTTDVNKVKQCVPCAPGSYKSTVIDSSCNSLCTMNATSKPGAHSPFQCYCQPGYYHLEDGYCVPCVEGARCDGGVVGKDSSLDPDEDGMIRRTHVNPVPIEGYYLDKINQELRKPDDWRFIMCPIKGACLGEKGCSESMTAYLCAECKTGYTNNFKKGTLCSKCPSTMTNLILTIAWYLGLLLVNIVMACLNVSAGYNRRSIHSVVIKIALNYGVCMSVLNVINFGDLALPKEVKSFTVRWFKLLHRDVRNVHTSIDCLLQDWFGMNHAVSFFYTMLYIACLPVILLVVVTILMWVILELFKIKRHHLTRSKLALLYQSSVQGMHYLADRLRDEYANERLFLIFRYIPLPGETRWVRFKHFLEDMIPIYVTVLFSVHGNTTSHMLSLLDCTCIHLGQSIPSKYVLRPAMSIKCSLDPNSGYYPYLLLGLGGLVFWGFGIPFFSYIVLLINRRNLYAPDVRMKYGFLHNGYQQDYWFWEAIVFTRKSLVLVIGSIVIVPSENTSASRIWMALAVAVLFLIIQLIYKPFDERDYFVLGRLESHSMISWTANLLAASLLCSVTLTPFVVMGVCVLVLVNSGYFLYVVLTSLLHSLIETIRYKRHNKFFRKVKWLVDAVLFFDSRRYSREPQIAYNQKTSQLQLKINRHRYTWFAKKTFELRPFERYYFVNIVTELYRIVVSHLKLDVMPKLLIEFLLRLSLSLRHFEEKMAKRELFQELSDGDLSTLVAWAAEKESRKLNKIVNLDSMEGDEAFVNLQKDEENLGAAIGLRQEELQFIMDCLFDDKVLECNTRLTDFYHCLTRIWIMDIEMLTFLFTIFRHVKARRDKDSINKMEGNNVMLRKTQEMLQSVVDGKKDLDSITLNKSIGEMEEQVRLLMTEKDRLNNNLKQMRENPDVYVPNEETKEESSMDSMMLELGFNLKDAFHKNQLDGSSSDSYTSDSEGSTDSETDSEYDTDDSDE
ncbi:kringle domain-containing protein [Babesia ovis]|uniref:Kringle domain-containing protein n=1 Tax=Babesia ovis TaxID=5869 RepID=A0A9W5WVR6_BABOV|nr:kringle domain-containing protein [Babesia ovis]